MKIIGFNFTRVNMEKFSDDYKDLKIKTHIDIVDVKQTKSEIIQTKDVLFKIKFNYNIEYEPKIAKISFSGNLLFLVDPKTAKSFTKQWKNKKFPEEHKITLFNVILKKTNLRSLQLEDELNLPLHISLPSLKESKKINPKI